MVTIVVFICLILVLMVIGRPPTEPRVSQTAQLEGYLHAMARRQAQLRQGKLSDW